MILNTKLSRKIAASTESGSVKNSIVPRIIQDPTVSPGCYLAVKTTYFFSSLCLTFDVIVSRGHLFPANDLHKVLYYKYWFLTGSFYRLYISFLRSEYVYGIE